MQKNRYSHNLWTIFQISKFDNLKELVTWRKVLSCIQLIRNEGNISIGLLPEMIEVSFHG